MSWLEALILGIIQGLTEFLPVSSSGHLELGKVLLNLETKDDITFTIVVHGATVLSTIIVFRKDILELIKTLFSFKWNDNTKYIAKLLISMFPVAVLGFMFKDEIKSLFSGNIFLVGTMLLVTALLLALTYFAKPKNRKPTFLDSIIIGIAQALATIPGISRSGSTIATGLLLGNKREEVAKFSFLMVLLPIIGANLMEIRALDFSTELKAQILPLFIGFVVAFITGLIACKWMIKLVNQGKLIYFAIYCTLIGSIAIIYHFTI